MALSGINAGMAWLDSFLAQAKATDKAAASTRKIVQPPELPENATPEQMQAHSAAMQKFSEELRQNVNTAIDSGKIISINNLSTATRHTIPDTVDGVETGFLNSRYITLDYLSRAEDLVENHPEVAQKLFDQGDSMHRMILTLIKNHDFAPGMETYTDATDKHYAAEGNKLRVSGMMSGLGNQYGLFGTSPEVTQFLQGNNYVNTMEKSVQSVVDQQEKIAQIKTSHHHATLMANNAAYREAASSEMDPELAAQFANAWQNEEALLRTQVSGAETEMKKLLQDIKNLESRGIAGDVTENLFNRLHAARTNDTSTLKDLYKQYGIETAEPFTDRSATSGFAHLMQQIEKEGSQHMQPLVFAKSYDFSNMSRQEIADAGKQLFSEGKITLDELFRFDHPDGKLRIDANGNPTALNPDERINFVAHTRKAISDMEATGEAKRSDSPYQMMLALLDKLTTLQG